MNGVTRTNNQRDIGARYTTAVTEDLVTDVYNDQVKKQREDATKLVRGTIVPDDVQPRRGQIRESAFLDQLAWRLTEALTRHVPWSETLSRVRTGQSLSIRNFLQEVRNEVIGPAVSLDDWLRNKLTIGRDEQITPDDLINRLLGSVDADLLSKLESRLASLSNEEINDRYSGEGGDDLPPEALAAFLGTASVCGPTNTPPGAIPPTMSDGQAVHLRIQEHYRLSHPNHVVLMESRIYFPQGRSDTVRRLSQGRPGTAYSSEAVLADFALTLTSFRTRKRPDILNLTTREVYEIKPRRDGYIGMAQLQLLYLVALNATLDIILREYPTFDRTTFKPGLFREWRPYPIYPVPPDKIAVTCADPFSVPGLIVYDLFKAKRVPALEPVPVDKPAGVPVSSILLLAIWTILLVFLVLTPVPGDELAGLPVLLRLAQRVPVTP